MKRLFKCLIKICSSLCFTLLIPHLQSVLEIHSSFKTQSLGMNTFLGLTDELIVMLDFDELATYKQGQMQRVYRFKA